MTDIKLRFSQFDDSDGTFFNHRLTSKERKRKKDINVYKGHIWPMRQNMITILCDFRLSILEPESCPMREKKSNCQCTSHRYPCFLFSLRERERELYLCSLSYNLFWYILFTFSYMPFFLFLLNRTFEISASQNVFQNPVQDWVAVRAVVYQDVLNAT